MMRLKPSRREHNCNQCLLTLREIQPADNIILTDIIKHKGETKMSKIVKRVSAILMAAAIAFAFMPAFDAAYAMNDMSPAGSVQMPASKTMSIAEAKEVKINFGTKANYDSYFFFQIRPSKTGYITFTNDYVHGSDVALCNASKKVISRGDAKYDDFYSANSQYAYQAVLHYGVKKGDTYYIRVKGGSTDHENYDKPYIGTVKWTNSAVKGMKYGKSKKKASVLKKNKTRKGLFVAGNKKAQWYKIKSKKKKIKISLSSSANCGSIKATVYYKSYGSWYNNSLTVFRGGDKTRIGTLTSTRKAKKTVYIKVAPVNMTSGSYQIKWR